MASQVDPSLLLVCIDWATQVVTLHRWDGTVKTEQLSMPDDYRPGRLRRTTWSPPLHGFVAETTDGDAVALELPHFDQADQLDGRHVVYLDQCIWRRMANAQHGAAAANALEFAAAQELISLVEQRKVILPLSSGHHAETARWGDDERRYGLGLTVLSLSRGWQMRDPLVLRRQEFRSGLFHHVHAEDLSPSLSAFTLDPNTLRPGV